MSKPTLSVVMPNYNHALYISEALESILQQSYPPTEVIIVDDASTDNSLDIIHAFMDKYPIIYLIQNKYNQGCVQSILNGLSMATGDYVYPPAADDKVLPGFFEKSMHMLMKYPEAGLCFSGYYEFVTGGEMKPSAFALWATDGPCFFSPEALVNNIQGTFIPSPGVIHKRSAFIDAGQYIADLEWGSDWFSGLVSGFRNGVCYIPEYLTAFRLRPDSYSTIGIKNFTKQRHIFFKILELLSSSAYSDVLPFFQRAKVLPCNIGVRILSEILSEPKYSTFIRPFLF